MFSRRFKQILPTNSTNKRAIYLVSPSRTYYKRCLDFIRFQNSDRSMSWTLRYRRGFKDYVISSVIGAWARSYVLNSMLRRWRRDRYVREVLYCFRQAVLGPRRTFLFTVSAATKSKENPCWEYFKQLEEEDKKPDDKSEGKQPPQDDKSPKDDKAKFETPKVESPPKDDEHKKSEEQTKAEDAESSKEHHEVVEGAPTPCSDNITDEELQALIFELDDVEELSKQTLYCPGCSKRSVIDSRHPGITYCACSANHKPIHHHNGWIPYMEADDVIIWRKEWKHGKGMYAYKVYGRYKSVRAEDFAAIQVDGAYRRVWDSAVAALAVVDRKANGLPDQAVIHWEVLWPRLFANRDYVYLRRHKEFDVQSKCYSHKDGIFEESARACEKEEKTERKSVHSHAKMISQKKEKEENARKQTGKTMDNKVYVIISRSCTHPAVPETKNAIRVQEYWSHMVVKSLHGNDKPGMEFVLTYYDEPTVGGLPSGISSWATGRAAPAFLTTMHAAAIDYKDWKRRHNQKDQDFVPFGPERVSSASSPVVAKTISELDMESSKLGPDLGNEAAKDQSTQTEDSRDEITIEIVPQGKDRVEDMKDLIAGGKLILKEETKAKLEEIKSVVRADSPKSTVNVPKVNKTEIEIILANDDEKSAANKNLNEDIKGASDRDYENNNSVDAINKIGENGNVAEVDNKKGNGNETEEKKVSDFKEESDNSEENEKSWWRNIYPFYYFV